MNQKDNFKSALPMAALDEIPQPSENAKEIVGLVKAQGKVTGYKLSDGQMVSKRDRKSTRLNSSHVKRSRMPSSA